MVLYELVTWFSIQSFEEGEIAWENVFIKTVDDILNSC